MGIPAYFRYLVANYDRLIVKNPDKPVSRLFLDLNCAIHPCVREVMKEYQSLKKHELERKSCRAVLDYIMYLVRIAKPSSLLYIAIDGVAPRAKMIQQRHRRFKSYQEFQELEELKSQFQPDYSPSERWDTNAITPGTAFMELLSKYLQNELPRQLDLPEGMSIILSDTNEPGEGEHKILQYLKNTPRSNPDTSDAIYGLDADLIMLSMSSGIEHLYLFRETVEFNNTIQKNSESLPVMLYVDIDYFKNCLFTDMERIGLTRSTPDAIVKDYIMLCFMLGNDFLPHQASLSIRHGGVETLQKVYCEVHDTLGYDMVYQEDSPSNRYQIRREYLLKIWEILSRYEESNIMTHERKSLKPKYITNREFESDLDREIAILEHYPVFNRDMESTISVGSPGWRDRYYQCCFGIDSEKEIKEVVSRYCQTLLWTLNYYLDTCPDWSWYYPYRHCPLFVDLVKYAPVDDEWTIPDQKHKKIMTPYQQLLLVLPPSSFTLLPKNYQKYLHQSLTPLTPYYPQKYRLDTYHKNKGWECPPILPNFDLSHLSDISKKTLTRDEKARIKSKGEIQVC